MKRLCLLAFLLLALAVPAWGVARTLYPAQDAMNWSAAEWSLADDNAKNQAKPAGGDTVYFTFNSDDVTLDENSAALAALAMDAAGDYVGTLALGANTLTVDGECDLFGTITGTGTIDAGEGTFSQEAAVANTVTLLLTTSGSHVIYWGGTGGSVDINCTGTYILATACNSYALTVTAGTLAGNGYTWTVDAGGFEPKAGAIFTSTLIVDLSATAGAYTQTAGEIAAAAVLNVTTGTGGFTWTALTQTGTVNITTEGITALAAWGSGDATAIDVFTINAATTASGHINADKVVGNALLTIGPVAQDLSIWAKGANFLSGTFDIPGHVGASIIVWNADDSNAGIITMTGIGYLVFYGDDTTWTQTGAMSVSNLHLDGKNAKYGALEMNAPLTVTDTLNFGHTTDNDRDGMLTLGSGFVHRLATVLRHADNTSTGHTFNPQGRVILGGTFTGTSITVTPTKEGVIDCVGVGSVYDVTSTGRRFVVLRAVHHTTGIPLRGWEDDSCTNVRFLGRKVIGALGAN